MEDWQRELQQATAVLENLREDVGGFDTNGWREGLLRSREHFKRMAHEYNAAKSRQKRLLDRLSRITNMVSELTHRLTIGNIVLGDNMDLRALEKNLKRHKGKLRMRRIRAKRMEPIHSGIAIKELQ